MYAYTVHVKRFMLEAAVNALAVVGFLFDDKPTVSSQDELSVATFGSHHLRRP
jgi:hypothetical protein